MIALAPLLLLGGVVFVEQPIEGVYVVSSGLLDADVHCEVRAVDLDGDGANDVVTSTGVYFQRDGRYSKAHFSPLPEFPGRSFVDVWKDEVFVLTRERIEALRWSKGEWQRTLSQPIEWGAPVLEAIDPAGLSGVISTPRFDAFLFDLDNDGKPEIVRAGTDGIHIHSKKSLFYQEAAAWRILPPLNVVVSPAALWPASARTIRLPDSYVSGKVRIDAKSVRITRSVRLDDWRQRIEESKYNIGFDTDFAVVREAPEKALSEPIDVGFRAVALNDDDFIDLMNVRIIGETAPPLPVPIIETTVSTDAGKSFFTARSFGALPPCAGVDYNQDGRIDLIAETKRLAEGGIRETLVRGLTRREVDLDVDIRLQDESARFPSKPTFSNRFTIELDKPPVYQSQMFIHYLDGALFSLGGDFDGDGTRDAAIHDKPNRIAIRKGGPRGIMSTVLATLAVDANTTFKVVDIDGDGRADLVVGRESALRENTMSATTVYLNRSASP